ncbi:MAG: ATP-binding cassette domain-containing protein, partial [Mucinivorans sp.]
VVLNPSSVTTNPYLSGLYRWSGALSPLSFTLVLAMVLLVVLMVKNLVGLWISYSSKRLSMRLFEALSVAAFADIYSRGLLYIRGHNSNNLINEVGNTTLIFATQVFGGWITILSNGFLLLLVLLFVAWYDIAVLGALLLLFAPFFVLYTRLLRGKMQKLGSKENEIRVAQHRILSGAIRGYTDVQITGSLPRIMAVYRDLLLQLVKPRAMGDLLGELPSRLIEIVLLLGIILLLVIQSGSSLMVVTLGVFVVAAYKVMPAINAIMRSWSGIQRSQYAQGYCAQINTVEVPIKHSRNEPFSILSIDGLDFAYANGPRLFTNYSLTVHRGERLLIKGASGCGKSTLLHIMMGFLAPQAGIVTINGHTIDESYFAKFGYVSQDIFIMDDTLLSNITMSPDAIDSGLLQHLVQSLALDKMGVAMDERLCEWGSRLSGGQRQRIAIARALYRGAEILILDEPTSALDTASEQQVFQSLGSLDSDLTIICVSHKDFSTTATNFFGRVIEL